MYSLFLGEKTDNFKPVERFLANSPKCQWFDFYSLALFQMKKKQNNSIIHDVIKVDSEINYHWSLLCICMKTFGI